MNLRILVGCLIFTAVGSTTAIAQNTLGELLDAGGKRLSKAEVAFALSGAHVLGPRFDGGTVDYEYKADGYLSGSGQDSQGHLWGLVGTWAVDESGRFCNEWRDRSGMQKYCAFLYILAEQHYLSESDTNRSARIIKRTIKK